MKTVKYIFFTLCSILLVGCGGSSSGGSGDITPLPPLEIIISGGSGSGDAPDNVVGGDTVYLSSNAGYGSNETFSWEVIKGDITLNNPTSPQANFVSDGVLETTEVEVKLTIGDTNNSISTHTANRNILIRPNPRFGKASNFDEKALLLGYTEVEIDRLCHIPQSSNGNPYCVNGTSVMCKVLNQEVIVEVYDSKKACGSFSSGSSAYDIKESYSLTTLSLSERKFSFESSASYEVKEDGWKVVSYTDNSDKSRFDTLKTDTAFLNSITNDNLTITVTSKAEFSNDKFSHNDVWIAADNNGYGYIPHGDILFENNDDGLSKVEYVDSDTTVIFWHYDFNRRLKDLIKIWQ